MVPNRDATTGATSRTIGEGALHERSSPRLTLFGSPAVAHDGQSSALPFERRGQLVACLAMKRAWVGRAEIAALLWPDLAAKLAYTNLRKTLFRLQDAPWSPVIDAEGGALRIVADTDVAAFEQALAEGRHADAVAVRTGELLAGFEDDANEAWSAWLSFERERLRVAWRGAVLARLGDDIEPPEAIDLSARLLATDPLDEAALRAHLSALARAGQSARARQVYRDFAARLSADLGLAPSADLVAFHDGLSKSQPVSAPPEQVDDEFVGRAVELRRIGELLSKGECRLLTIVGPGGVGKTRLAERAQREAAAAFADGAAFVSLEGAQSAADVATRVASELGVRHGGKREAADDVAGHLRGRRMLLVLDNFEEAAAHAFVLERWLAAAPKLGIVVTSRVRLAIASEWLLPLEGLPCPEPEDHDRLDAFDAARLFVQAARRVEPALVPSVESGAIVDICRQLEGLPLALLLAAAWTRVLSCSAIADELRRGTELLQAADAAMPARHASMQVVFEQSWKLLAPIERETLARLSVFRGGAPLAAVRAVTGASLPVLAALADKSLVRKESDRFLLHPLVQQLAALKLAETGTHDAVLRAHADWFLQFLAQAKTGIENGRREALQSVEAELDNCRAAWQSALARADVRALLAGAPVLMSFCDHRGLHADALALVSAALDVPAARDDPRLGMLLLSLAAHAEYRLDRFADAQADAERALAVGRRASEPSVRNKCLNILASCFLRLGRYDDAWRVFEETRALAAKSGNVRALAVAYDHLALVAKAKGDREGALRLSLQSLAEHRRLDDRGGEALCLNNLAVLEMERGDLAAARAHLIEALAICERNGLDQPRAYVLSNLADIAFKTRDLAAATDYTRRALALSEAAGTRLLSCLMRFNLVILAVRSGDRASAHADLGATMRAAIDLGTPAMLLAGLYAFAEILFAMGDVDSARRLLVLAADHPRASAGYRAEFLQRLAEWPQTPLPPALALSVEEIAERIASEDEVRHAPLIAVLRAM